MQTHRPMCLRTEGRRAGAGRAGFTLIELLVVVAVIGILASLIMPAVLSAMSSGQSTRCKSNLRQIAAALMDYTRDYNGMLPASDDSEARVIDQGMWWRTAQGMMVHYLKDFHVFQCPADTNLAQELGGQRWWSYGWNTNYYNVATDTWRGMIHRTINEVKNSVIAITFLDHTEADGGVDGNSDRPYMPAAQTNPNLGMQRHNGGFNALFLDGHVEQLRPGPDTSAENFEW